ncbi:MAG: WhiB family transcriptional regulator [Paenisporosarcina sp.]
MPRMRVALNSLPMPTPKDLEWANRQDLPCLDADLLGISFYPGKGYSTRRAQDICQSCPVLETCYEYAVKFEHFGVWGGTSERERQRIRHDRLLKEVA